MTFIINQSNFLIKRKSPNVIFYETHSSSLKNHFLGIPKRVFIVLNFIIGKKVIHNFFHEMQSFFKFIQIPIIHPSILLVHYFNLYHQMMIFRLIGLKRNQIHRINIRIKLKSSMECCGYFIGFLDFRIIVHQCFLYLFIQFFLFLKELSVLLNLFQLQLKFKFFGLLLVLNLF